MPAITEAGAVIPSLIEAPDQARREPERPRPARLGRGDFMQRFHRARLRLHLAALVLIGLVPAAALLLYTTAEQESMAVAGGRQEALRLARMVAGEHERAIDAARQLLMMLAQLPEIRQRPDRCTALVTDLVRRYPRYGNIGALTSNGTLFCSAAPLGEPVEVVDRAHFWRALDAKDFEVSDYQVDRLTGRTMVNVSHPLLDDAGAVQGAVFAAIDLAWLQQLPAVARLPEGVTVTIGGRDGRVRIRYPDPARWTGQPAWGRSVADRMLAEGEGSAEAVGPDGVPRIVGFTPLRSSDAGETAYLAVGLPRQAVVAAADRVQSRNLLVLGLIGVLALAATRIVVDRLAPLHARDLEERRDRWVRAASGRPLDASRRDWSNLPLSKVLSP